MNTTTPTDNETGNDNCVAREQSAGEVQWGVRPWADQTKGRKAVRGGMLSKSELNWAKECRTDTAVMVNVSGQLMRSSHLGDELLACLLRITSIKFTEVERPTHCGWHHPYAGILSGIKMIKWAEHKRSSLHFFTVDATGCWNDLIKKE